MPDSRRSKPRSRARSAPPKRLSRRRSTRRAKSEPMPSSSRRRMSNASRRRRRKEATRQRRTRRAKALANELIIQGEIKEEIAAIRRPDPHTRRAPDYF